MAPKHQQDDYIENLEKRCEELQVKVSNNESILNNYQKIFRVEVHYVTNLKSGQITSINVNAYVNNTFNGIECCDLSWSKKGWALSPQPIGLILDLQRGQSISYYADFLMKTLGMEYIPYKVVAIGKQVDE